MIFKYYEAECDGCKERWSSEGTPINNKKEAREELRVCMGWIISSKGFCFCSYKCEEHFNDKLNNPPIDETSDDCFYDLAPRYSD